MPTETPVAQSHEVDSPTTTRVQATPLVRRIAQDLGVDLASIAGSGAGGRVTEDDVRAAATSGGQTPGPASEGRRLPIRGVRRLIVEHLTTAHREIPAVTFVEECDFTDVDLGRLVPLTLQAVAASLRAFPELNARLEGDEIVLLDRYDLGLAVQTDAGSRRPGRPRLRHGLARRARRRDRAPRRRSPHGRR